MKNKKKKAFTLVELLAVIVILAVILVIAIPQIMNVIKTARISSFKDSAILIATNAEKDYLSNKVLNPEYNATSIPCSDVAKLNEDYEYCKIIYDDNTALIRLVGSKNGKFSGITCQGSKDNIDCSDNIGYVTDNLLMHYDGIKNTLSGHDNTAPKWLDLVGNRFAEKIKGNIIWEEDALLLDGNTYYSTPSPVNDSFGTVEVVVSIDADFTPVDDIYWFKSSTIFGCEIGSTQKDWAIIIDRNGYFAIGYNNQTTFSSNIYALDGKKHVIGYSYTASKLVFYIDGKIIKTINYIPAGISITNFGIGWNTVVQASVIKGKIYNIRYYKNQLLDDQIKHNYNVDRLRFNID